MSDSKLYVIELGADNGPLVPMLRLVRCKECVWGKAVEQVGCVRFQDRGSDGPKDPDGFCAWGEEKKDER